MSFVFLNKFVRSPWSQKKNFLEACCWLALARMAIVLIPFRRIAPHLGHHMEESPATRNLEQLQQVRDVAHVVQRMADFMPWQCKCLAQAISAKMMLQRRGVSSTLYLGVAKKGETELCAHAWLRSGDRIVTGRDGMKQFAVVSFFT